MATKHTTRIAPHPEKSLRQKKLFIKIKILAKKLVNLFNKTIIL